MEFRSLTRPAAQLLNTTTTLARPSTLPSLYYGALATSRGHKTAARTKRALKIAPHDSFLPDRSAAFPAADSIIYNPPASEATPFHTPFIFLPRNDPRRAALVRARSNPGAPALPIDAAAASEADLPPAMRYKRREPKSHLTAEHVEEMRRLRKGDPLTWSSNKLAEKFKCSTVFVRMVAPAPKEHLEWLRDKLERKKARWGPIKTQAREDRSRRADMLYRGEL